MSKFRLLIVEDSAVVREVYLQLLEDPDLARIFDGSLAKTAEEAIRSVRRKPPDVVILDWILPDKDGMMVLDAIRTDPKSRRAQVFVVTSQDSKGREVEALQLGADDYMTKPFEREVLKVRLLNMAKRMSLPPEPSEEVLNFGDLRLEMPAGKLKIGAKTTYLHRKEAQLLWVFLKRPDMIHSMEYLWDTIWGYETAEFKNTLRATLSGLRQKLGPRWGSRLESMKEQGYILRLHI